MKPYNQYFAATVFCLLVSVPVVGTANEIGLFLSNEPDCKINSTTGSAPCRKDTSISAGDIITTKLAPATLSIQWLVPSYVRFEQLEAGKHKVIFTPPPEKNSVLSRLGDLLGFARKAGRISHVAVTRSGSEFQQMLPGDGATLLPGQPVTFSWCVPGIRKIEIFTDAGVKVKEVAVPDGHSSITVKPEDLRLATMQFYRWRPVSKAAAEGGRFILLGGEKAKTISDALLQIDIKQGTAVEKGLQKAAFLQFVSENYADEYSLGWLQYSLVSNLSSQLSAEDRTTAVLLKARSGTDFCE